MKIQDYLSKPGVKFELHEHAPAYTAQELAAEEHVSGDMFAKAVVVRAGNGYAICALPASFKLDLKKAAQALECDRVRLADETEMSSLFPDVEVGAEPPLGKLYDLPTVMDSHLAEDEEIVFQAGTHRHSIRMKYADYAAVAEPTVADIAVHV
jgi:Ala-tRNA(Pro) deacylase